MNYVTFKIEEERDGEFVLYLNNHDQGKVFEQLRSRDIDEIVLELKEKMRYRKHFMNALGNYAPVLNQADDLEQRYPEADTETFPESWTDPLQLYGCYAEELKRYEFDLEKERRDLLKLIKEKSPEYVWQYRAKLIAERIFIETF